MRARTLLLAALFVGLFVYFTSVSKWDPRHLLKPVSSAAPLWSGPHVAQSAGLNADELNNIEIYKSAKDATVHITSTVYRRGWFMEIYPSRNSGSGFIINDQGFILTNNHVVSGNAQEIRVTLADKSNHKATLLVQDPANDLALIRIPPSKDLKYLRLGDSDKLQVGQKVLAIGNPFGLEGTLTTGVISSMGRTIRDDNGRELEGMIQTDAAINPGNSGGPLLDSQGSAIGINTAIYGPGGNIGIGFAMPVNRAKMMIEDYQNGRKFTRPKLGVSVVHVSGDFAEAIGLPSKGGLLIQGVERGSAAANAGLRGPRQVVIIGNYEIGVGGDLIMAVDGRAADRPDALSRAMARKRPGDTLDLTIFRNGRQMEVKVQLGEPVDQRL